MGTFKEFKKGHKATFGIFNNRADLEIAVANLKDAGFSSSDISVLMPSQDSTSHFAHEHGTKAPEGTATGVTAGAAIGGGLGWLAGIGSLAIPGIGPFVAAGPIMAALAGATVGGAVGGVTGALIGMGIPEYEAKRYEGFVQKGSILLSVHVDNAEEGKRARNILDHSGAHDIDSATEKKVDEKRSTSSEMPRR